MQKTFKYLFFICFLILLGAVYHTLRSDTHFQVSNVTSTVPFRFEWVVDSPQEFNISGEHLTFLGEGGQSYAFTTKNGEYVVKFFKFNRFRPSPFFQMLPNIVPLSSYIQSHTFRRQKKLETAFAGYKLAYDQQIESGLQMLQLNSLDTPLYATLELPNGQMQSVNLQHIPFVVQRKGEMLSEALTKLLNVNDLDGSKNLIDQLFALFRLEYSKGLIDLDRGIMHNIGSFNDGKLFHLDVGNLALKDEINTPHELKLVALKVGSWLEKNFKEYVEPLKSHMQTHFKEVLWDRQQISNSRSRECENLFKSGIYFAYNEKLNTFLQEHRLFSDIKEGISPLDRQMQQLIATVNTPLGNTSQLQRKQHENYLLLLRHIAVDGAFQSASEDNPSKQLYKELIDWIFLKVDLKDSIETFFSQYITYPALDQHIDNYLSKPQQHLHGTLKLLRNKNKLTAPEDHYFAGNLPLKIGVVSGSSQTTLIRLAEPLIGNKYIPHRLLPPSVSPEFLQFLKQQPRHLYVNLMRRNGKEGPLTSALENLNLSIPQLSLVTLDKDSDFYWQKGAEHLAPMDSAIFKTLFLDKLTEVGGAFFWPQNMDAINWKNKLQEVISSVHRRYFSDETTLTKTERQDFIELTYCGILNALLETLQPSSMNITCRQSMDRGPSLMTLWLMEQKLISNSDIATLMLAPPLIIHQRTAHAPRIARLISAASLN